MLNKFSQYCADEKTKKRFRFPRLALLALPALLDNELEVYDTETAVEVNLAMLKFRHVVKRKNERILPC